MGKKHCKIFKQPSEDDVLFCAGTLQHYNPCQLRQSLSSINRCQAQRSKVFAVTLRSLHLAVAVQTMICPPVGGLPLGMPGRVAEERSMYQEVDPVIPHFLGEFSVPVPRSVGTWDES